MKKINFIKIGTVVLVVFTVIFSSCKKIVETLDLSLYEQNLEYQSGEFSFEIKSNTSWTVTTNQDWLTVINKSNKNDGKVIVNYKTNIVPADRNANIIVTTEGGLQHILSVKQKKQDNRLLGAWKYQSPQGWYCVITFNPNMNGNWKVVDNYTISENKNFSYDYNLNTIKLSFVNPQKREKLQYKLVGQKLQITKEDGYICTYIKQ